MSVSKLNCCERNAQYKIQYETGDIFLVCNKCIVLPHFARHIKDKKEIKISEGQDFPSQPTDESRKEDSKNG